MTAAAATPTAEPDATGPVLAVPELAGPDLAAGTAPSTPHDLADTIPAAVMRQLEQSE